MLPTPKKQRRAARCRLFLWLMVVAHCFPLEDQAGDHRRSGSIRIVS
jgi:hypothetical protein